MADSRILISIPNWVGDVVMATPALRAIRRRYPDARITHIMRPYVAEVLAGTGFADEIVFWPGSDGGRQSSISLIRHLRDRRFDLAVLLTNSFRSALTMWVARVTRRVGYARDGRGWMLTDRLTAPRVRGRYVPIPALDYYNQIARYLGCDEVSDRLELAASPEDEAAIDHRLGQVDRARSSC